MRQLFITGESGMLATSIINALKDSWILFIRLRRVNGIYYYKQTMKYHDIDANHKYSIQDIYLSGGVDKNGNVPRKTLKNIERSIKRPNPKSWISAGT